jgi:hypothetical protein
MSLGLGIFLGCLFLGTVFLYTQTREAWNWRKAAKWTLISLGSALVLMGVVIGGYLAHDEWERRPQPITSLEGISVGEKMSDVVFRHGEFKRIESPGARRANDHDEDYSNHNNQIHISVRDGVVRLVSYVCKKDLDYTRVNTIGCGSPGDLIQKKFPGQVRVLCARGDKQADALVRVYDVVEYGTRYLLARNEVHAFIVAGSEELKGLVGINWHPCQ